MATGTTRRRVTRKKLEEVILPVPPILEQKRIVQKIESCFEKIDSTEANLNKAEKMLEKYRESLLAKAFRGELVPQDPNDEPANVLLEKIRKERAQNQKGKKAEQEFAPIAEDEKPFELPAGWEWGWFGEIITYIDSGWSPDCETDPANIDEWGVLKTTSVQLGEFKEYENKKLPKKLVPKQEKEVQFGDFLITRAGPKNRVGICCLVNEVRGKLMISDKIIRCRFRNEISPEWILIYLTSTLARPILERCMTGMAESQVNISQEKLKFIPIPLPPLNVQINISNELKSSFGKWHQQLGILANIISTLPPLKESILNRAFEGRLVEQISSEGTGHELLAKILSEKNINTVKETKISKVSKKTLTKSKGNKNGKK